MRNFLGFKIETKISLAIVLLFAIFCLAVLFRSVASFNKFTQRINQYEELRIEKGK